MSTFFYSYVLSMGLACTTVLGKAKWQKRSFLAVRKVDPGKCVNIEMA